VEKKSVKICEVKDHIWLRKPLSVICWETILQVFIFFLYSFLNKTGAVTVEQLK